MYCWCHTCVCICKKISSRRWSFLAPGSEKKWYSFLKDHEENGIESLNWWWSNSEKADTQFSEPRVLVPRNAQKQKAKEVANRGCTSVPMGIRLKLFFAQLFVSISSASTEHSQMCVRNKVLVKKNGETRIGRTIWPIVWASKIIDNDTRPSIEIPAQAHLLQKYKERVERLSQQDRVIQICNDAGFLKTVEVGQYFMTKHTDEFSRFTEPVTCREHTLPRDEKSTDPKGWIRGKENPNWTRVGSHNQ